MKVAYFPVGKSEGMAEYGGRFPVGRGGRLAQCVSAVDRPGRTVIETDGDFLWPFRPPLGLRGARMPLDT